MLQVLLLEPNYNNKYPPLGLMKISYYHKGKKGDRVQFAKGTLPEELKDIKWDRVYVTSLFTFEWEETKKAIEYALQVARDSNCVYVGGIAATLMKERFMNEFKDIPEKNFITGLLNVKGKLGYEDDDEIDKSTPDYSMLDDILPRKYPAENAYFMYTTRGCGMKCGFCAVQTLEPKYEPRIEITEKIKEINEKYGPKKDLLLMDNNVLISPRFDEIIDELYKLGFEKGARYKSPASGKYVNRYVDFNQGLDAFLLVKFPEKVRKLSELAIRPARIAFDHIEDTETYKAAIKLCAENGITELSNYILYNSDSFTGKGKSYNADTPLDLYNRLKITMDLKDEIDNDPQINDKVSIFSFPMRYIPLQDDKRGYVGEKWNTKYLRAIQRMLIPTQGKGVSSRSFFEADFGKSEEEYMEVLAMPEDIIAARGRFVEKKDEPTTESASRLIKWQENKAIREEWQRLFNGLKEDKEEFIQIIQDNVFNMDKLLSITEPNMQKLFLHYFSESRFLTHLNNLQLDELIKLILDYCLNEFPLYFEKIINYIYSVRIPYSRLVGFINIFGDYGIKRVIGLWIDKDYKNEYLMDTLNNAMHLIKYNKINLTLVKIFKSYTDFRFLSENDLTNAINCIKNFDNDGLLEILKLNFNTFRNSIKETVNGAVGEKELKKQIENLTEQIYKQLSLFDLINNNEVV
jgi:hypothetical protein